MVPKGTIIGAGQAAALIQDEMNMVDILGALWPHAWALYAAHLASWLNVSCQARALDTMPYPLVNNVV